MALWMGMLARSGAMAGSARREPVIAPARGDRRFSAHAWRDNPWYGLLQETSTC